MKISILLVTIFILLNIQTSEAQLWDKIKKKAEDKIAQKAEQKADEILNGKKEKKNENDKTTSKESNTKPSTNSEDNSTSDAEGSTQVWRHSKFIPGEKVIFYDDQKNEEVGEFPSRWDLSGGAFEVVKLNDEKVIMVTNSSNSGIIPLFTKNTYLPDEFTVEFDVYADDVTNAYNSTGSHTYRLSFYPNQTNRLKRNSIIIDLAKGELRGSVTGSSFRIEETPLTNTTGWNHVALTYHHGKTKLYLDGKRVLNLPKFPINPGALAIGMQSSGLKANGQKRVSAIKNFKIAEGGGSPYSRIIADGKYVTNGILFDSGKATIKPVSTGLLNKLKTILDENKDWKFKIVGHTDSDGDANFNLKLSKKRAEAVKGQLSDMGISPDRLTTEGKGESAPLNDNSTQEEKANNRRVEFIQIK